MVSVHDGRDVEFAVDTEFFQDAGFGSGGAGVVVVFEPLEAVGGSGGSVLVGLVTDCWVESVYRRRGEEGITNPSLSSV